MDTKIIIRQAEAELEKLRITAGSYEKSDEDLMPDAFVWAYEGGSHA